RISAQLKRENIVKVDREVLKADHQVETEMRQERTLQRLRSKRVSFYLPRGKVGRWERDKARLDSINTKELHHEIEMLQARIKELEAALADLQSKVTSEPHPLLAQSLQKATEGLKSDSEASKDTGSDEEELVDTFGSLTLDTAGETRNESNVNIEAQLGLPIDLLLLSRQFPFKNVHEAEDSFRKFIRSNLPSKEVAFDCVIGLHSQLSWATPSVVWEDVRHNIFDPIYTAGNVANDQQVAILFITMALAVLADPKRPMYHPDSHRYYHLSRASMSLGEQLLAVFNGMINDSNGANRAWGALSLAIRIAQMVHRDNEQWNKYPEQAERRRRVWWDLVSFETGFGFALGRPRAIHPKSVVIKHT
ncbi:459_t:CDS:2, partial [Acaulospora colombiana]